MCTYNITSTIEHTHGPDFIKAYNRIVAERHAASINMHGNKLLMGAPVKGPHIPFGKRVFNKPMCHCIWCKGLTVHPNT